MRRRLYIFAVWMATFGVLLSMVVMHHHHQERVCTVVEECTQDGRINDEHTSHNDSERDGCQIHQMHHFLVKAKGSCADEGHYLADGLGLLTFFGGSGFLLLSCVVAVVKWQDFITPLWQLAVRAFSLRGPPSDSFSFL